MNKLSIKTNKEIQLMKEGGKLLSEIKDKSYQKIDEGVSAFEIDLFTKRLIKKAGGKPSFAMVPGYQWATCVNINSGLVHGIPKKEVVFDKGDVVSVDMGLFYKGFHTDTSITKGIGTDKKTNEFLRAGEKALEKAISVAKVGNYIYDISKQLQDNIENSGANVVRSLVGHGIGRNLHEEPQIPNYTTGNRFDSVKISKGMVFAIEVMYTMGSPKVNIDKDGWTISMKDGKISALFEETVAVTKNGPLVLTKLENKLNLSLNG